MKITFLFPETKFFTKKGLRNKKIPDISNLYELVQDVLQKVEILEDDNLVESHDGSRRTPIKGEKYWLEIEITKAVINPV